MDSARDGSIDETRGARDLLLEMEHRRGWLRRDLRRTLRSAIQDGRLARGTRLPSSRRLAADLGMSRGVVADTYDQLAAEGYLAMSPRQAPMVVGAAHRPMARAEPVVPAWRIDFRPSSPDLELFPRRAWGRAVERALRTAPNDALDYGDHRGRIELRQALSAYLGRVRGVCVEPASIVVTQGFTQALDLVCRVLRSRGGTSLAFESPSLASERATVEAAGLRVVGCPVDEEGVRVDAPAGQGVSGIVVSPAHQFPTGVVLSPARRTGLVDWAARESAVVIEDDYDAEFRYDRMAVGAVQGLDPDRVVHLGTASKTLAPALRMGWMSLPASMVDEVQEAKGLADSGSPAIDQLAMADLLSSGEYDRHVARVRHIYRRRRDRLVAALGQRLPALGVQGAAAGLHVLLRLPGGSDDVAVGVAAAARGVNVGALSPLYLGGEPRQGLLLGYGRLAESRVGEAVEELAECLRETALG